MGDKRKSLADLQKDLQVIRKNDMNKITGGKSKHKIRWNSSCRGIVPQ